MKRGFWKPILAFALGLAPLWAANPEKSRMAKDSLRTLERILRYVTKKIAASVRVFCGDRRPKHPNPCRYRPDIGTW